MGIREFIKKLKKSPNQFAVQMNALIAKNIAYFDKK